MQITDLDISKTNIKEVKNFTNLDILRTKRMSTEWVAEITGCSPSTIRSWSRKGMFHRQDSVSYGFNTCPTKFNVYSIVRVLEWLKENNKVKYANALEEYLNAPYKCESCLFILKKPENECNNSVLEHDSKYGGRGHYICYDCYMNRIAKEELGVYEKDGVLRCDIYHIVEKDWAIYSYALEYAKHINKSLEMIIDKEYESTTFVFR